ncbi:MAG TPA: MerR family transcriptional regulator [Candidatus Mediterraneibacter cottocaccae]|nr:MerR family transcriptional regulator [Candidatus Mediterraneibacter cottocaccae]
MTIKETEKLTAMTRANIRFYESEGLLTPSRDSNGYRNYTDEDVNILKRIRLLRTLHLSLEDIKAVSRGEQTLAAALNLHIKHLQDETENLRQCREVCRELCRDQVSFDDFDAQTYLDHLTAPSLQSAPEMNTDKVKKVTAPWRRFFARSADFLIYFLLWNAVLSIGLHINIMGPSMTGVPGLTADIIAVACLLLLIEPVLLSLTGTTPGKFMFGLRVTTEEGNRLSHHEALVRAWDVLRKGLGYGIPVYNLYRYYQSYKGCQNGEVLYWEEDSVLHLNERFLPFRAAVYIFCQCLSAVLLFVIWQCGTLPLNRGEITAAQFCENFNRLQDYYNIETPLNMPSEGDLAAIVQVGGHSLAMDLTEDGTWESVEAVLGSAGEEYPPLPRFQFTEEDGILTAVSFTISSRNNGQWIPDYRELLSLSALSLVCARDDYTFFPAPPSVIRREIEEYAENFESFDITEAGVRVNCSMDYTGYSDVRGYLSDSWTSASNFLVPDVDGSASFTMQFTMEVFENL